MKKFNFYILIVLITLITGFIVFFVSDYSRRVKLIFSLFKENDKEKIITKLTEKVESDTMKIKLQLALKSFSNKIENDEYTDEYLQQLIKDFEQISNLNKIDSATIEEFYHKVRREF